MLAATPLGRPADASARLIEALGTADIVAAEDTRRVRTLAQSLGSGSRAGWSASSSRTRRPGCRHWSTRSGRGRRCSRSPMRACRRSAIPATGWWRPGRGRSAAELPAGSVGGDDGAGGPACPPTGSASRASRRASRPHARLAALAVEQRTCVFFESPRRLAECLRDAVEELGGERRVAVCRELTKTHEEVDPRHAGRARRVGGRQGAGRDHRRARGGDAADIDTLVAEVAALIEAGGRQRCVRAVIAANPGAPSRRGLYDAVPRSRQQ